MIARPGRSRSLYRIPALGIAFQVEFLRHADIDIFRVPRCDRRPESVCRIGSVDNSYRPCEVSVVGIAAEFDAALRRPKDEGIVCGYKHRLTRGRRGLSHGRLAENVIC